MVVFAFIKTLVLKNTFKTILYWRTYKWNIMNLPCVSSLGKGTLFTISNSFYGFTIGRLLITVQIQPFFLSNWQKRMNPWRSFIGKKKKNYGPRKLLEHLTSRSQSRRFNGIYFRCFDGFNKFRLPVLGINRKWNAWKRGLSSC